MNWWHRHLPVLTVVGATIVGGFVLLTVAAALLSFLVDNALVLATVAAVAVAVFAAVAYLSVDR